MGPLTAATLVAFLPELGHWDSKALTSLVGLAPWSRDSGRKRGQRAIRGGRGVVREALYLCACSVIQVEGELRRFYQNLRRLHGNICKMNDDKRATDFLAESVRHSIGIIEGGIKAYVFQGDESAYRSVSTELRKLLVDKNAVASFRKSIARAKRAKCLLELHYGNGRHIFLKSFRPLRKPERDDYVDITPDVYPVREHILYAATHEGKLVSLHEWLEDIAYTGNGEVLKVGTAIKHIAGHEGSHIINPVGDKRVDVGIAFLSEEPKPDVIENIDFNHSNPWRQVVIDAGMRLLAATSSTGDGLILHTIDVPQIPSTDRTVRIQRTRQKSSIR